MTPDRTHAYDQATAGVDELISEHVKEARSQLADGDPEEDVTMGFHLYLTQYTTHTRDEFATLYMRAVLKMARSGETI